ncbi:MAG: hypothetical protein WDM96_07795 [Lacunisphaera sp.]
MKSIQTSSANENSAPVATTPPIAVIQLLKSERSFGALGTEGTSGMGAVDGVRP